MPLISLRSFLFFLVNFKFFYNFACSVHHRNWHEYHAVILHKSRLNGATIKIIVINGNKCKEWEWEL